MDEGEAEKECLGLMKKAVVALCEVLGMKVEIRTQSTELRTQAEALIADREAARKNKDFKKADQIRKELAEKGIILEDTPLGARWKAQT